MRPVTFLITTLLLTNPLIQSMDAVTDPIEIMSSGLVTTHPVLPMLDTLITSALLSGLRAAKKAQQENMPTQFPVMSKNLKHFLSNTDEQHFTSKLTLGFAIAMGRVDILKELLLRAKIQRNTANFTPALALAIEHNDVHCVDEILKYNPVFAPCYPMLGGDGIRSPLKSYHLYDFAYNRPAIRTALDAHRRKLYHHNCRELEPYVQQDLPYFIQPHARTIAQYAAEYPLVKECPLSSQFLTQVPASTHQKNLEYDDGDEKSNDE